MQHGARAATGARCAWEPGTGIFASRIFDLGPHDALGQRRRGRQVRVRDLLGREPADFAQRQRDLRVAA